MLPAQRRHRPELQQSLLQSLPVCVIATDVGGVIVAANPVAERLLGYARDELLGRSVLEMHDAEDLERRIAELSQQMGVGSGDRFQLLVTAAGRDAPAELEWVYRRKDGEPVPVTLALSPLRDETGGLTGLLMVAHDITPRRRAEAYIRRMAHYDALTGLPNRTLLLDRLDLAIRQARRKGEMLAVLMLDLDHFKRVNDSLGHQTGDQLLVSVGRRIQQALRDGDTVARFGGDEFVMLLPGVRGREELAEVLAGVVDAVAAPLTLEQCELAVTPSVGACLFPEDGLDSYSLLGRADAALYQAKAIGRGCLQWYTPRMLQQTEEKLAMGNALRRAIGGSDFLIHYQPEVSLKEGRVVGMEALLRWSHGTRGPVAPERFVPLAEETGLIVQLGEWVLLNACSQCAALQRELGVPLSLAVNVSPRQLMHRSLLEVVRRALERSGLQPRDLEVEITEGMLMQDLEESSGVLAAIRELGVSIVIDDFGTGYSSLSYLTRLPIDKIKIDRSFVRDLHHDSADAAVINAIIALAHSLNIRVIAEGVESGAQEEYLRRHGCDEAQGFHYSEAVSARDFAAYVAARS